MSKQIYFSYIVQVCFVSSTEFAESSSVFPLYTAVSIICFSRRRPCYVSNKIFFLSFLSVKYFHIQPRLNLPSIQLPSCNILINESIKTVVFIKFSLDFVCEPRPEKTLEISRWCHEEIFSVLFSRSVGLSNVYCAAHLLWIYGWRRRRFRQEEKVYYGKDIHCFITVVSLFLSRGNSGLINTQRFKGYKALILQIFHSRVTIHILELYFSTILSYVWGKQLIFLGQQYLL